MFIISNNCCGGRMYQLAGLQYNNPFIWCVVPYDSIIYIMNNFNNIDWYDYTFEKSTLKPSTFIIKVQNKIEIHYVHHYFNALYNKVTNVKKNNGEYDFGETYYCKIWEYLNDCYLKRIKRMKELNENPVFLIEDENYANNNSKYTIKDIANNSVNYKRIIITTDKTINNNINCKIIAVNKIENPLPTITKYFNEIKDFI